MTDLDSTQRFSTRVENYIQYRPHYPSGVLDTLREACGLVPAAPIADIGSGTGLLTEVFLRNGNPVYGVEPNREMREAGEKLLQAYPNFHSVNGTAEATTLPADSVAFVTAGQAFHWFDWPKARVEFARILRPGGWVALIWNDRELDTTPFLVGYEQMLQRYGTDYKEVTNKQISDEILDSFFGQGKHQLRTFPNVQEFDFAGLRGRLQSSSYAPQPGHPNYEPMLAELTRLFDTHQENGRIKFLYTTQVFLGQV